jgi:hypothetical protein
VQGVVDLGVGDGGAAPDDRAEPLVVGHLPFDDDTLLGQAAVGLVRLGRESRPQQYGAGPRVTGGDAEREGVVGDPRRVELGGARRARGGQMCAEGERGGRRGDGQEAAACKMARGRTQFGSMP